MARIFKFIVALMVIVTFLSAIAVACFGLYKCFMVYYEYFNDTGSHAPVADLVKVVDYFLISFVFLILSVGFSKLFLNRMDWFEGIALEWLEIKDLSDLKYLLWDTILLAMVVAFGASIVSIEETYSWPMLVMPVSIALLAVAVRFLRHK